MKNYLEKQKVITNKPAKLGDLYEQFIFIKTDVTLNKINPELKTTPLKMYAQKLKENVYKVFKSGTNVDILGRFYGAFVKYGGNDGNALGIVLTPHHITKLMTDLIYINKDDFILDPCCGSGGFLISAMNKMLESVKNDIKKQDNIKHHQIYGIELQQKLYAIASTNMILRGDGYSNIYRDTMFFDANTTNDVNKVKYNEIITKVLINPPYSQAKNKDLWYLSEINFIYRALQLMKTGGKLAAIVPLSTMVGKTKKEQQIKTDILKYNTLESVITCNSQTFYGVGTNPCIAIFKAGIPHDKDTLVNFVDFTDDGYEVRKHIGLVDNGLAFDRKKHLLNVLNPAKAEDDTTKFIVRTTITAKDEWLHSYFYFNEEIPKEKDFLQTIQDYLSFKFDMTIKGKGYLFENSDKESNE